MTLFVDSSMFYAAVDRGDRDYERAKHLLEGEQGLTTTDHVLVETWLLLHHRIGRHAAEAFWEALRSGGAGIEPVGLGDLEAAWAIGEAVPTRTSPNFTATTSVVSRAAATRH